MSLERAVGQVPRILIAPVPPDPGVVGTGRRGRTAGAGDRLHRGPRRSRGAEGEPAPVRDLLRGHQLLGRRRHLCRAGPEPVVRGLRQARALVGNERRRGSVEADDRRLPSDQPEESALAQGDHRASRATPTSASSTRASGAFPWSKGPTYRLSLQARGEGFDGPLTVALDSRDGRYYAKEQLPRLTGEWKSYECTLTSNGTDPKARLEIVGAGKGTFWLDMVSLFPAKTWKDRPNGLRPDLAEMLADLKPAFVRFPGGCWVEGDTMKLAYRWKETIGDLSERRTQYNIWNYHATHGLGFHEYLQMCEDLGAEPLFVINCGMSHRENVPMEKMGEFVQDALDAIEYCNGPADSTWGAVRAKNGHPAPFNLKYMEIGNENGGPAYQERYALFHDAIKKAIRRSP